MRHPFDLDDETELPAWPDAERLATDGDFRAALERVFDVDDDDFAAVKDHLADLDLIVARK